MAHKHTARDIIDISITAIKTANIDPYIVCRGLLFVLFPDNVSTALTLEMGSEVALIFTVTVTISVNLTVERRQDDIDGDIDGDITVTVTVFDGIIHVEVSRVEYPGIMAKVDELEHRVESCELGEYTTKHFGIRVGISELLTCIRYLTFVSLFV